VKSLPASLAARRELNTVIASAGCLNIVGMLMDFEFDRTVVRKRRLSDREPSNRDWVDQAPAARLAALEFLRRSHCGETYASASIQRVHRITRKARS
jgi:hypothetical protein